MFSIKISTKELREIIKEYFENKGYIVSEVFVKTIGNEFKYLLVECDEVIKSK